MGWIRLNGAGLTEREAAMDQLGTSLGLPDWWGRNLDALHDCLTDGSFCLALENCGLLEASPFGRRLLRVLTEAAGENPNLKVEMLGEIAQKD